MVACDITGDMRFEVRQILCILIFYQTFYTHYFEIRGFGFWVVTLLCHVSTVETDTVYQQCLFTFSERDGCHDMMLR